MDAKDTLNGIPHFFFDLISRFIPGSIFLLIYLSKFLNLDLKFQTILTAIIVSYLIGFIFNILSGALWHYIFYSRPKLIKLVFGKSIYLPMNEIWKYVRHNLQIAEKNALIKTLAECLMFRTLTIIPISFFIERPLILSKLSDMNFILFALSWVIINTLCTLYVHRNLSSVIKSYELNENKK